MNDATNMFYPIGHSRSSKEQREFEIENLIYNTIETLMVIMEKNGAPQEQITELAKMNGHKLTISKLSKICFDAGVNVKIILNDEYQLI